MTRFLDHSLTIWTPFLQILTRFNDHFRNLNCRCLPYPTIYNPPDRKPRAKCIKREVSAHLNLFFRGNSMAFIFLSFRAVEMKFFLFCKSKEQRQQRVPVSHFPTRASRNWDDSAKQRLLYSFCCSLQHVFAHIDVTPLSTACVH